MYIFISDPSRAFIAPNPAGVEDGMLPFLWLLIPATALVSPGSEGPNGAFASVDRFFSDFTCLLHSLIAIMINMRPGTS